MENMQAIINEIKDLRGSTVRVFGQSQTIDKEVSRFSVDILDVLNNLKSYEVDGVMSEYNEENDEYEETETNSIDDYLNYIDELYGLEEISHDNSYNWNSTLSNDIDFIVYKYDGNNYLYKIMIHKFGDVRTNYTDYALLKFDNDYDFLEELSDCTVLENVYINDIEYCLSINPLCESIEVSVRDSENCCDDIGTICGYYGTEEEIIEDIKDLLIEA